MSDDIEVTPGTGKLVSTEEITTLNGGSVPAKHVQRFLLAFVSGTSAVDVPGDALNGIDVDVTRLPALVAGTAEIGGVNQTRIAGTAVDVNSGVKSAGTQRVVLATDQPALTNALRVDGSGTTQPVSGTVALGAGSAAIGRVDVQSLPALPAGTNAIGRLAANSGVDIGDVDVTSISAGANAIGNVGLIGRTTGGLSTFRSVDLDETEEDVKTSAGQVFGYFFANLHATAWRYVKLYNATAANVTVGTTSPVRTLPLPPNSAGHVSIPQGLAFSTAISAAATTGLLDNDTGAPGTNEVVINIDYV